MADKSGEQLIGELLLRLSQELEMPRFICDIGGNVNADVSAPFIAKGWGAIIVEPQRYCYDLLCKKFQGLENVRVYNCGCSDKLGYRKLFHGKDGAGSEVATLSEAEDPWASVCVNRESYEYVEILTLSKIIEDAGVESIGILKIDTESWDYNVLRGLDLKRHQPYVIVTEEFLWDVEATIAKHLLLEEGGYVNLGFIGYNTFWVHRKTGCRWTHAVLAPWCSQINVKTLGTASLPYTQGIESLVSRTRPKDGLDYGLANVLLFPTPQELLSSEAMQGDTIDWSVTVTNLSDFPIPSLARTDGSGRIAVAWHLFDAHTKTCLVWDGCRTQFPRDLASGDSMLLQCAIEWPKVAGLYVVEFLIVQEGVAWFSKCSASAPLTVGQNRHAGGRTGDSLRGGDPAATATVSGTPSG